MIRKFFLGCILLFVLSLHARSQNVKITGTTYQNGNVIIRYDLSDDEPDRRYTLRLYSSLDDFIQPLELVSGDIGVGIPVGGNKQIFWNAREEVDSTFSGQVALEIKGQIYIPFISLEGFEDYNSLKRGNAYEIVWAGGRGDNILNFDLYKGKEKVHAVPGVANTGHYTLEVPKSVPPGKNYRLRVADANNRDEVIYSDYFTIRRKYSLGTKLLASTVAAAGIYFLIDLITPPVNQGIPDPTDPPTINPDN